MYTHYNISILLQFVLEQLPRPSWGFSRVRVYLYPLALCHISGCSGSLLVPIGPPLELDIPHIQTNYHSLMETLPVAVPFSDPGTEVGDDMLSVVPKHSCQSHYVETGYKSLEEEGRLWVKVRKSN